MATFYWKKNKTQKKITRELLFSSHGARTEPRPLQQGHGDIKRVSLQRSATIHHHDLLSSENDLINTIHQPLGANLLVNY